MIFNNNKKTIVIFIGIQASGKSTFRRKNLSEYEYINLDTLKTRKKEDILLNELIKQNKNIVIDNTNITVSDRKKYITAAQNNNYKIIGVYFRSSIDECKERNFNRLENEQVPVKAIIATAKKTSTTEF